MVRRKRCLRYPEARKELGTAVAANDPLVSLSGLVRKKEFCELEQKAKPYIVFNQNLKGINKYNNFMLEKFVFSLLLN